MVSSQHPGRRHGAAALVLLILIASASGPALAGGTESQVLLATSTTVGPTAYGPPEVFRVALEYAEPPHLSRVTYFRRPVYVRGLFDHWEVLYELTQRVDACNESLGPPCAEQARVVEDNGSCWLEVRYSCNVYHSNPQYGTFQVGTKVTVQREPLGSAAMPDPIASGPAGEQYTTGLDIALRRLTSVEEFADYSAVRESYFAQDIEEAFYLGLIQGKYDEHSRFFDPQALITTGEMLNILARNLGAPSTIDGIASAQFLAVLGITAPGDLQDHLSLAQLGSLATQIAHLGMPGKGDLLVLREALTGSLTADYGGGITRAHAVAMFREEAYGEPPFIVRLPDPSPHDPTGGSAAAPGSGPASPGPPEDPGYAGPGGAGPPGQPPPSPPLFVLTD